MHGYYSLCLLEWNHFGYQATCQPQFSRALQMHILSWWDWGQASQSRPERPVVIRRCTRGKATMQLSASPEWSALGTDATPIWMVAQEELGARARAREREGGRKWGIERQASEDSEQPSSTEELTLQPSAPHNFLRQATHHHIPVDA